jgi:hypothetical protein
VVTHPEARTTKGHFMATQKSTAHPAHPSTEDHDHLHACLDGVVYIGLLVEEDGEEVEVVEAVPCRRCAGEDY